MSFRATWIGVGMCLVFAGCESTRHDIATGVREKFAGPTYERRVLAVENDAAFESARAAVVEMGFRITRFGAAQGVIDGVSGITPDERLSGSRQRTVKVRLSTQLDGGTEVAVLFTEIVEDSFGTGAGQGTEANLRNHPLYEAFWGQMARALKRRTAAEPK